MKKLLFVLALALTFTSCQKEDIQPNVEVVEVEETGIDLYGEWKLLDGQMFIENMDTGVNSVYDHFSPTKPTSSLRYEGAQFEFETIEAGVTTWEFIAAPNLGAYGEFILNGDTNEPYGLNITNSHWTVMEHATGASQLGGSSRPISAEVESYDDNIVVFLVQEGSTSIGGYNCMYYSKLRFQKQ